MKNIKYGIIKKVDNEITLEFKEVKTENTLQLLYDEIECRCVDCPYVSQLFVNNNIDTWIDDEGKLIEEPITTALIMQNGKPVDIICGNIVIASHDEEGGMISLTEEQIKLVKEKFVLADSNFGTVLVLPE